MRIHLLILISLALGAAAFAQQTPHNGPVWPTEDASTAVPVASSPAAASAPSSPAASIAAVSTPPASAPAAAVASTPTAPGNDLNSASYLMDDKHILEPGDKVSFRIIEDKDPPRELIVADSRELDVPYVGRVSVEGKTCKQLAHELKAPLEREYYYRATVIVGLDEVNKIRGKIYVSGQVRNQGAIDLYFDENLTVQKAILRAGGFADFANKRKVKVIRNANNVDTKRIFEVNLQEVLDGKTEKDIVLEPDDLIEVPSRAVNF